MSQSGFLESIRIMSGSGSALVSNLTGRPPHWLGLGLAGVVFLADQASKVGMRALLPDSTSRITVLPVFDLVHAWNYGVSFSMFAGGRRGAPSGPDCRYAGHWRSGRLVAV
jgi:hypothetical protein